MAKNKTNLIGIIGLILIVTAVVAVFTNKATLTEAATFLGGLAAILTTFTSFLAKDGKVNILGKVIPGRGFKERPKENEENKG